LWRLFTLFYKFSSSCFSWSKEWSDHMLVLVMLNSTRNWAVWYGVRVPCTTLHVKPVATYIVSSSLMSTYEICKVSMNNCTCLVMMAIKQKWIFIWKHNLRNELGKVRKTNIRWWHFVVLF
jgi:hypothetical protein